jgi:hypothetical protein
MGRANAGPMMNSARQSPPPIASAELEAETTPGILLPKISTAQFNLKRHFSPVSW